MIARVIVQLSKEAVEPVMQADHKRKVDSECGTSDEERKHWGEDHGASCLGGGRRTFVECRMSSSLGGENAKERDQQNRKDDVKHHPACGRVHDLIRNALPVRTEIDFVKVERAANDGV